MQDLPLDRKRTFYGAYGNDPIELEGFDDGQAGPSVPNVGRIQGVGKQLTFDDCTIVRPEYCIDYLMDALAGINNSREEGPLPGDDITAKKLRFSDSPYLSECHML